MNYYIVTDKNFLSFEWGKSILSYIHMAAKRYGITVTELCGNHLPQTGFLLLVGVDSVWLSKMAELAEKTDMVVVNFMGQNTKFNNRIIQNEGSLMTTRRILRFLEENAYARPAFFGVQKNDGAVALR